MTTKIRRIAGRGLAKIFGAMLLIVVIMFASNYLVYQNSLDSVYSQVSENNKRAMRQVIKSFDDSFKEVNDLIYSVQALPYDSWKSSRDGDVDMAEMYKLYKEIAGLATSSDYIENVVVFRKNSELALTATGTISLPELFRGQYSNKTYDYAFWRSSSQAPHPLQVFPAQTYSGAANTARNLIPVAGNNRISDVNILVFLNTGKLLQRVNQTSMMQGASIIVFDQSRNFILSTEANWGVLDAFGELAASAGAETTIKNKGFEYTLFQSEYNDFIYMSKTPYAFGNIKSVADVNRSIIMAAIVCAILMSGLLSLYLYRPLQRILALIGGHRREGTDLRHIITQIKFIQQENESLKAQAGATRKMRLAGAFAGALHDASYPLEAGDADEIFPDAYFLLASFSFRPNPDHEQATPAQIRETMAAIRNGLQDKFAKVAAFPLTFRRLVAVIGVHQPSGREQAVKQLRGFVKRSGADTAFKGGIRTEVSRMYASEAANLHQAYRDLEDGAACRNIDTEDPITDYQAIHFTWKVHFPVGDLEKASYSLAGGNEAECVRLIDEMLAVNAKRRVHLHQLVSVVEVVFYHLVKSLEMSDIEPKEILFLEREFKLRVDAAFRCEEIRDALVQAIGRMAGIGSSRNKKKLNPESIAQYIELHYMDNLGLDHMAEQWETSPKYFSNYFKRTFHVNFVEYLNKVRLAHAKDLLINTEIAVSEIGSRTGFLNASTFASTFSKYAGMPPSEYRRQHIKDQHLEG